MRQPTKRRIDPEGPVRVLGRGLHALRGVHLTMRALRDAAGKTQVDVAADAQMDQADISRLESRANFDDCQVATLQRYVSALGGQLELVAAFGNKRIVLSGVTGGGSGEAASKVLPRAGRKAARP